MQILLGLSLCFPGILKIHTLGEALGIQLSCKWHALGFASKDEKSHLAEARQNTLHILLGPELLQLGLVREHLIQPICWNLNFLSLWS
jgi:hypothetical protein